jgi:PAS domain S-box-containing protein
MNRSGSLSTGSRSKGRVRRWIAALCLLRFALALGAAEPAVVRIAVSEGRDIRFRHLTSKDGLSFGQIRDIVQDDQGFLWFNTSNVLNRYDGYQFKSYRRDPAHPNYPSAAGVLHVVFKDGSGFLWVSSSESLDRFDPATETTTRFPIDRNGPTGVLGPVRHISQDRAGVMWLSTDNGLHRLDPANGTFRHYSHNPADPASLSSSVVRSTYEDRQGTLWVCTVAGLDAFDRHTETVTDRIPLNVPESVVVKALEDHAGVLWIIYLSGNGLASWNRHSRRLTLYSIGDGEPPGTALSGVQGIHEDADGNLWLATRGSKASGLVKIDSSRKSAVRYRHYASDPESLSDDMLMSVFEDREGSIWVGTATTGVDRFQRKPLPFKRYRNEPGNPQSLLRTSVTSVYADSQENIWVGSSLGLTRIDGKSGEYSFFRKAASGPANLSNPFVTSIVEDRSGFLWFGTYGGLNRYDPRTGRFTVFRHNPADPHSLSHDAVSSLMVDHQGGLWAGTSDGFSRLEDPAIGRFRSWKAADPAGTSPQEVGAMVEDPNGALWLVSGTLQRFDPTTGRFTAYMLDPSGTGRAKRESSSALIRTGKRIENSSLTIDQSGALWVATVNGLVRFDRDSGKFTIYDERDGLPAAFIHGILEDRNGNLWVSTLGGLSRFNPRTKTFTNYRDTDGLAGNAFEGYPAACQSRRGQMFFGSKSGLTSFWPEQIVERPYIPPVVLTGFSLRNVPVAPGPGTALAKSISFAPPLTLSHDQNLFSFEFAALSYVDPQRNQYRYMLEPLDRSWNRVDAAHRMATFTTLPAGKYTLRVQGSNHRGLWNEQGVALQLQVLPPWWGTWWFRGICAAVLLILAWVAYQLRIRQLQREFKKLQEVIEAIPAYVWSALPDGSVDFVNRRWLDFSGFSLEQASGWGWSESLHPDDRDRFMEAWRTTFASGQPMEAEVRVRRADGQYRWLLVHNVPLRDKAGKIVKWYGKSTDIDDRKRAEQALRLSEAYLADAQRLTGTGAWASDGATRPLYWSKEVFRIFGFDPEQGLPPLDKPLERVHPEDRDQFWRTFQRTIQEKVDSELEYRVVLPDGTVKHVHAVAHPVADPGQEIVQVVGTIVDITNRKRAEEERARLRQLEADLAHINRVSMMGELAASIAHEVNQPLTGIVSNGSACLRFLAGDAPNLEEAREAVSDIVRDGKRAGEVIARIRALTKRAAPPRERLDLNETIRDVLAITRDQAKRNSVVIGTQFAADLSPVFGDRVQLQQVLLNLVINAMEAMSSVEDRARQLVITTWNAEPGLVQVTVADSGTGLDPDAMARIFEPFHTTKTGGMGMGLSISRSIVQNHGGRLWATANDGPGTRFHFSLPKYEEEEHNAKTTGA